ECCRSPFERSWHLFQRVENVQKRSCAVCQTYHLLHCSNLFWVNVAVLCYLSPADFIIYRTHESIWCWYHFQCGHHFVFRESGFRQAAFERSQRGRRLPLVSDHSSLKVVASCFKRGYELRHRALTGEILKRGGCRIAVYPGGDKFLSTVVYH